MTSSAEPTPLGPGREFDLIRSFLADRGRTTSPHVLLGPGDDAAIVTGGKVVLSVDLSVEDVHFRRRWMSPFEIGYRSAAAGLSDLAAMAAQPVGILASLAVAPGDVEGFAIGVMSGIRDAAEAVGAALLGGDLTRSPGPLIVDVISVGRVEVPVLRLGAEVGQELWVTGSLGGAAFAVRSLQSGERPDPLALEHLVRPRPRIEEAIWLSARGLPTAMLDLSDGLGKDAAHLAAASRARIVIEAGRLPIHPSLSSAMTRNEAVRLALSGGEDYELCFTAIPGSVDSQVAAFERRFGILLHRVGTVEAGTGVFVREDEEDAAPYVPDGFTHFGLDG